MHKSLYYYMTAGATTGIAGILHLVLEWDQQRSVCIYYILYHSRNRSVILGNTTHKTMGKNMVLCGNRRYNCFDDSLCTNKATKSNYRRKSINNQWTRHSYRNIPGSIYNNYCINIDETKNSTPKSKGAAKIIIITLPCKAQIL